MIKVSIRCLTKILKVIKVRCFRPQAYRVYSIFVPTLIHFVWSSINSGLHSLILNDCFVFNSSTVVFNLPDSQVIMLPGNPSRGVDYKLSKGDVVFAIYPDTTSFYKATVVQVPRKSSGGGTGSSSSNNNSNISSNNNNSSSITSQFVLVHFVDDADEFGVTHDKAVIIQHVMPPPPST
jgi:SGF29 tudor-like domain